MTIVPKYDKSEAQDDVSDQEYFYFRHGEQIVYGEFSVAESLPIVQSLDPRSGLAATPEAAAKIALRNWIASQRERALHGTDIHLQ